VRREAQPGTNAVAAATGSSGNSFTTAAAAVAAGADVASAAAGRGRRTAHTQTAAELLRSASILPVIDEQQRISRF
jgi:hypothetical protein